MKRVIILCMAIVAAINLAAKPQATPVDTVDVVCYDLQLNTDFIGLFGMAYIFANNSDYKLTGAILADSIPPGTYTDCMMDLVHLETNKQIPAISVTINLSVDQNRNCAIVGEMLGEDNILYNLDLSWQTPTTKDTVTIAFDNSSWVAYYPDLGHDFMLSNENDNYDIALDIVQVAMGDNFTEKNLNIGYLLDFYGEVLSERKRLVLDMYYNEDFSLSEISEEIGISRQGVRDLIKKAEEELCFFETKLGLKKKMTSLEDDVNSLLRLAEEQNAPKAVCDSIEKLKISIEQ